MGLSENWHVLLQQMNETDLIQWFAVGFGVAEVWLAKANKIWLYPTGIASTLITIYVLVLAGLYAECLLNGYYLIMSIYGWWYWIRKKNVPPVTISYCTRREWIIIVSIVMVSFFLLVLLLRYFTDSTVPVWDAWISATAWAGMWLLAKRKIENWILLNISNLFAIPLLYYKQLPFFAALTLFLFIIGIMGYYQWKQLIQRKKNHLKNYDTLTT